MSDFDAHERALWSGRAETYAATFGRICAGAAPALLDAAVVTAGTRMLDVGTGPGTVGRLALARGAAVHAVDAEPSMVALARNVLPDVRPGLLPDLPFPDDAFDAAVANFVVNHVGDPVAAIRGMARVVRPGGRVAVTVWPAVNPATGVFAKAFEIAGVEGGAPRVDADQDFPRTTDGLASVLERSGLVDVDTGVPEWQHRVDPDVWWSGPAGGIGGTGWVLTRQDEATVGRIRAAYDALVVRDDDGLMTLSATAVLAWGTVDGAHPAKK